LKGTAQSFSAFFASAYEPGVPAYVTKGSLSFFKTLQSVSVDNVYRRVKGWLRRDGWMGEVWADRWAEGEGKGGI
jgi:hypothetical protein